MKQKKKKRKGKNRKKKSHSVVENPHHLEDFNSLLEEAIKRPVSK